MATCFLSYSGAYKPLMETVRRLLETLDFKVDVFDGPDLDEPPEKIVQQRVADADCLVLLLGPHCAPNSGGACEAAVWPIVEGVYAMAKEKPLAIVLHRGTPIPGMLEGVQTPVQVDFWDDHSLVESLPHLVKHLLDLKRHVDLPPGTQPFVYRVAETSNHIGRDGNNSVRFYHEAVARQECSEFRHVLDTGMDLSAGAKIHLVRPDSYYLDATLDPGQHRLELVIDRGMQHELDYCVKVSPPLKPGERLGYYREFVIRNTFPLTREELLARSRDPKFPALYRENDRIFYGDVYDVVHEMDCVKLSIHLPRTVPIRSQRAFAYSTTSSMVNRLETDRCNSAECLHLSDCPDSGERILLLTVRRPSINHSYGLLYEL